jgi:hypothetical protein
MRIKLSNGGELFESYHGNSFYYLNGKMHREDGPAVEYANGNKCWYLNDERILCTTQKQFERLMRLKAFW